MFIFLASANRKYLSFVPGKFSARTARKTPIVLAAALEYLCAEILELAGHSARDHKRYRIVPRDIYLAVHNDAELSRLFSQATIAGGGAMPNIHEVLLPKRSMTRNLPAANEDNGQSKRAKASKTDGDNEQGAVKSKKRKAPAADEDIDQSGPQSKKDKPAAQKNAEIKQSEEF